MVTNAFLLAADALCWQLMHSCWAHDPAHRPTFYQLQEQLKQAASKNASDGCSMAASDHLELILWWQVLLELAVGQEVLLCEASAVEAMAEVSLHIPWRGCTYRAQAARSNILSTGFAPICTEHSLAGSEENTSRVWS